MKKKALIAPPSGASIGAPELRYARETLRRYKAGKVNLESRILSDYEWYRMRHWHEIRKKGYEAAPASAWLFNAIAGKHADAMDAMPEPAVLPREAGDREDAARLSAVLPVILEKNAYGKLYSNCWDDKLIGGTAITGVFWDPTAEGGRGDIVLRRVDVLSLFWEPGVEDIQAGRNLFHVELFDWDELVRRYPALADAPAPRTAPDRPHYAYDDTVDTSDKCEVVDWYYKRMGEDGRVRLHYCKFVGDTVLFATENEPAYAHGGWYDHGRYPFVLDPLFSVKGSPCGFSYVDIMKDCQLQIDLMGSVLTTNARLGARRRFFTRKDGIVNEQDYADFTKDFVAYYGSGDPRDSIMPIEQPTLPAVYVDVLQQKITELKETSGNRDFTQGGTTAGVTAASAIAALQESGSKLSRDMLGGTYRAFEEICALILELIGQFYDAPRQFRIVGRDGHDFISLGGADRSRAIFDIKVKAQKQSPFTKLSQNELACQLYQMGLFAPENAERALICLSMMDFEGRDQIMAAIRRGASDVWTSSK